MRWRTAAAIAIIGSSAFGLWGCAEIKELAGESIETVIDVADSFSENDGGSSKPRVSPTAAGKAKRQQTVNKKDTSTPKRPPSNSGNSSKSHVYASFDPQTGLTVGYYTLPEGWQADSTVVHNPAAHVFWRDVFCP